MGKNKYSTEEISFDYPKNWKLNPKGFLTLGTGNSGPVTFNAGVDKLSIGEYASEEPVILATMDSVINDIRKNRLGAYETKKMLIAGENGIEYTPIGYIKQGKFYSMRVDVYFVKGDNLYNIWLTTTNYEEDRPGFDLILKSILVK